MSDHELRSSLSQALAQLYAVAIGLPQVEPSSADPLPTRPLDPLDSAAVPRDIGLYWSVDGRAKSADATPEPTIGDLYDDLAEIRRDVHAIIDNASGGLADDLVWQARFDFQTHWSWHALDALRALHPSR